MIDTSKQIKIGSLLSYIQMFAGILVGVVYTPIMVRTLGQSEYGLYQTVASTMSMLSILSLGFNSGYIRYYAKYKKENDFESIYRLNGLFLLIFLFIGFIALLCGLFLTFNLELVFDRGLSREEYKIAAILMVLSTINLSISFPMSVFGNIISAHEKFIIQKSIGIIKTVIGPMVILPLLLLGYKSIAMVTVSVIINLFADIWYFVIVVVQLKQRFIFHGFEKGLVSSLGGYTIFIAINMVVDQINWNIDKILLARFKGTIQVAVYSVGYSLYNYYMQFATSISSIFTPRIHNIYNSNKGNAEKLRKEFSSLFIKVGRIQFLILALIATGLSLWGKVFIAFWVGGGYEASYYVALLLVVPASIALIQNCGIEIQRALNKHKFRSLAYAIMAIINLVISIILCQLYGAIGSAAGTAISLIVANGIVMNIYYYRYCYINIPLFWKNILSQVKGLWIPVVVGICEVHFFLPENVAIMIFEILIYTIVYAISMWNLGLNSFEKELIKSAFIKVRKTRA